MIVESNNNVYNPFPFVDEVCEEAVQKCPDHAKYYKVPSACGYRVYDAK